MRAVSALELLDKWVDVLSLLTHRRPPFISALDVVGSQQGSYLLWKSRRADQAITVEIAALLGRQSSITFKKHQLRLYT